MIVSETIFIERFADIDRYEALARYVSILAGGHASVIDTPLTKPVAAKALINGTITKSMSVARTVREANGLAKDPVEAVINVLRGWLLFKGNVEKYE